MVVTADGVWRGTKLVELKRTVEEALRICESQKAPHESHRVSHVIVVRNLLLDPATAASDKRPEKAGARPVRCAPQARLASPRLATIARARRAAVRIRGSFLSCLLPFSCRPFVLLSIRASALLSPQLHILRAPPLRLCGATPVYRRSPRRPLPSPPPPRPFAPLPSPSC